MPHVERSALVHYSAEQMYELVADVEAYPEFLPWCGGAEVKPDQASSVLASIDIAYLGIRARFTTRNEQRFPVQISMSLVDGPFRVLEGQWRFVALRAGASKVQLSLDYQFGAGLLEVALAPAFDVIANSMVDSFAERAEALYGPVV
jgi:ribosome-associated toxin RatA of RatAB toxin-antitoxin module